jgi:hypothetical protein
MNRDFSYTTEMHPGAQRLCKAIALREESSRASDAKETG